MFITILKLYCTVVVKILTYYNYLNYLNWKATCYI